jgi:hypothetical protein
MVWVEIAIFTPSELDLGHCRWVLMVRVEIAIFPPSRADLGHSAGGFLWFWWKYLFFCHWGLIWGAIQVGFDCFGGDSYFSTMVR